MKIGDFSAVDLQAQIPQHPDIHDNESGCSC